MTGRLLAIVLALALVGCASTDGTAGGDEEQAGTGAVSTSERGDADPGTSGQTTGTTTTRPPVTTTSSSTSQGATDSMTDQPDGLRCETLTDFEDAESNGRWAVVNDDVMGGRSLGGLAFVDGALLFEGDINTNGGGFASLRLTLEPEALVGADHIRFRARPDGRDYMVTFDDNLSSRDRRVSHRAPIGFDGAGEWQTVSVAFADLFPAIFGQPVDDLPFRPDLATRLGLMISDGRDGPFRLDVDRIELCQDPEPAS